MFDIERVIVYSVPGTAWRACDCIIESPQQPYEVLLVVLFLAYK